MNEQQDFEATIKGCLRLVRFIVDANNHDGKRAVDTINMIMSIFMNELDEFSPDENIEKFFRLCADEIKKSRGY